MLSAKINAGFPQSDTDGAATGPGSAIHRALVSGRWSTFGPHAIGVERFATVSSGPSFAQVAGAILGKQPWWRTLIRMRSQVQVLPATSYHNRGAGLTRRPPRQTPTTWSGSARTVMSLAMHIHPDVDTHQGLLPLARLIPKPRLSG